jgi:outer membrane murein-binding lipoprotein Lpp
MDLQTIVPQAVLGLFLLAATYVFHERLRSLEAKYDRIGEAVTALTAQVAAVTSQVGGLSTRLDRVESEVAALRSDITQIALAVGARTRPQTG